MSRLPLSAHATQPLLPLKPWSSLPARTWTPTSLSRERVDFFDTRVTGRQEIWAALRTVTELIRSGELDTAQGILDASGITTPTGNLLDGCYDGLGSLYKVPQAVISDPIDIAEDSRYTHAHSTSNIDGDTIMGDSEAKAAASDGHDEKDQGPGDDLEAIQQRREEKGKSVERDAVKVRCRLSDRGGPDVIISLGKSQNVGTLVRRVAIEAQVSASRCSHPLIVEANIQQIPSHSRVRVAYLGKILSEKETLATQGWKEGHVLNALVTPLPPIAETA